MVDRFRRGVVRLRAGVGRGFVGGVGSRVVRSGVVGVVRFGVVGFPGLGGELVSDGVEVLGEGRGRQQGRNDLKRKRRQLITYSVEPEYCELNDYYFFYYEVSPSLVHLK